MIRKVSKLVLVALLCGAPLAASSVLEISFDRLSRSAKRVVSGEIVRVSSEFGDNGFIYTDVTLLVRNAAPRSLEGRPYTFRTIGGEVDGKRLYIQGMPRFEVGQEVAVFLHDSPATALGPTVGLWQGVFFVERDGQTGQKRMLDATRRPVLGLEQAAQGAKLLRGSKTPVSSETGVALSLSEQTKAMPVDSFFEQVRAYRGVEF
ncbi:MAG: hypothetical protein KDC27_02280 [Acidobacteria bacterium]|nr:hypothetical protein [Acidobacteriota bacterium]